MLQVEVQGGGPDLVMLHGWGMHSGIWSDWVGTLASEFRVHCVTCPVMEAVPLRWKIHWKHGHRR